MLQKWIQLHAKLSCFVAELVNSSIFQREPCGHNKFSNWAAFRYEGSHVQRILQAVSRLTALLKISIEQSFRCVERGFERSETTTLKFLAVQLLSTR